MNEGTGVLGIFGLPSAELLSRIGSDPLNGVSEIQYVLRTVAGDAGVVQALQGTIQLLIVFVLNRLKYGGKIFVQKRL